MPDIQTLAPVAEYERNQRRADMIFMLAAGTFLMVCLAILGFAGYGLAHFVGWAR